MRNGFRWPLAAVLAVLLCAPPAAADDVSDCVKAEGDQAIAACTRAINSGRWKGRDLYPGFYNRALAYQRKDELDRAIADFNEVIRLVPKHADGSGFRGLAYRNKGCRIGDRVTLTVLMQGDAAKTDGDWSYEGIAIQPCTVNRILGKGRSSANCGDNKILTATGVVEKLLGPTLIAQSASWRRPPRSQGLRSIRPRSFANDMTRASTVHARSSILVAAATFDDDRARAVGPDNLSNVRAGFGGRRRFPAW